MTDAWEQLEAKDGTGSPCSWSEGFATLGVCMTATSAAAQVTACGNARSCGCASSIQCCHHVFCLNQTSASVAASATGRGQVPAAALQAALARHRAACAHSAAPLSELEDPPGFPKSIFNHPVALRTPWRSRVAAMLPSRSPLSWLGLPFPPAAGVPAAASSPPDAPGLLSSDSNWCLLVSAVVTGRRMASAGLACSY